MWRPSWTPSIIFQNAQGRQGDIQQIVTTELCIANNVRNGVHIIKIG